MQPNANLITITDNLKKIEQLLQELVLTPRVNALKWAKITRQTPNIKVGYPGQHLASLITGMEGERTGARGNDLRDGSEVKSCSRIDQLDRCRSCDSGVSRVETSCPNCGSGDILRNNDSKWLFSVRNQDELDLLTKDIDRVVLIIGDYPNFDTQDYETLRFQAFEIWPKSPRNRRFVEIMTNYYNKIYLVHKSKDANKVPAPKNFWPYTYQFYMCNPILTFSCTVTDSLTNPKIQIDKYVQPHEDRSAIDSVPMPTQILTEAELDILINEKKPNRSTKNRVMTLREPEGVIYGDKAAMFDKIDESLRDLLPLRDTDKISSSKTKYSRKKSFLTSI